MVYADRKWNDYKEKHKSELKTGAFTVEELRKLQQSIIDYCFNNKLNEEGEEHSDCRNVATGE